MGGPAGSTGGSLVPGVSWGSRSPAVAVVGTASPGQELDLRIPPAV